MPTKRKPSSFPPKEDGSFTTQTRRSQTRRTTINLRNEEVIDVPDEEESSEVLGEGKHKLNSTSVAATVSKKSKRTITKLVSKTTPSESENEDTLLLDDSKNNNKSAKVKKLERSCG
ncbi:hypothetical protein Goshw_029863 [Gossypium schwendimanii]|uniref:Uncharacterized protein n=1 Tax=Gossypium schwendimanii TaxID=34291 RepID=A0A7J9M0X5_GOSSC|nr:hypothetical protein [Gossypium schwendimanii]